MRVYLAKKWVGLAKKFNVGVVGINFVRIFFQICENPKKSYIFFKNAIFTKKLGGGRVAYKENFDGGGRGGGGEDTF